MTQQRTARSVHQYAQHARFALALQVLVAALALVSTVWFGARIKAQNEELAAQTTRLQDGVEALTYLQQALQNIGAQRYDSAVPDLRAAAELLSDADAASTQLLLQLLAEAQYQSGDVRGAIATIERVRSAAAGTLEAVVPTIRLAKYSCAADEAARARELVMGAFAEANRDLLLGEAGFRQACGAIAAELEAASAAPAPPPAAPDSPFKVRLVFLQVRNESDRPAAIRVARSLCDDLGYSIPGIERVAPPRPYPTSGELRYYCTEQKGEAAEIGRQMERMIAANGWPSAPLTALPLVGFDGLPMDRIEVWLPERRGDTEGPPAEGAADQFACFAPEDAGRLVERLNSGDRNERVRAGQIVANRVKDPTDAEILEVLLDQLDLPRLTELSASGRLNILYMLNVRPTWNDGLAARLRSQLDEIEGRASAGIAIGNQTQDCLNALRRKLAGERAADTCGGI